MRERNDLHQRRRDRTGSAAVGVRPGRHRAPSAASRPAAAWAVAAFLAVVTATGGGTALTRAAAPSPAERAAEGIVAEAVAAERDWDTVEPMPTVLPRTQDRAAQAPRQHRAETVRALNRDAAPVEGLDAAQMANAVTIIEAGMERGLGDGAWAVALATAMQEAGLYNAANPAVPESYGHGWETESWDHDSIGVFQQRPSMGWGPVADLMDPAASADRFYRTLEDVGGWEDLSVAEAAQAVQVSAHPDRYAQWEDLARRIIDQAVG